MDVAGALLLAALGIGAILCWHIWLPLSTFRINPIASILGFFLPVVNLLVGLIYFREAKFPLIAGGLCFVGAVSLFVLRSLVTTFFEMPT